MSVRGSADAWRLWNGAKHLVALASLLFPLSLGGCAFGMIGLGASAVQVWVQRDKYFGHHHQTEKQASKEAPHAAPESRTRHAASAHRQKPAAETKTAEN